MKADGNANFYMYGPNVPQDRCGLPDGKHWQSRPMLIALYAFLPARFTRASLKCLLIFIHVLAFVSPRVTDSGHILGRTITTLGKRRA